MKKIFIIISLFIPLIGIGQSINYCDEPIPVGETIDLTMALIGDVYERLEDTWFYLDKTIEQLQEEIADLYGDPKNPKVVCNFDNCKPYVIDQGGDLKLSVSYLFGEKDLAKSHIGLCAPQECQGSPCPEIAGYEKDIEGLKNGIIESYFAVKDIIMKPTETITDDIRILNETKTKTNRVDIVRRKLNLTREWLHASPTKGKRSCIMSEEEQEFFYETGIGARYPKSCYSAFIDGLYFPKIYSEKCKNECLAYGIVDVDCLECVYNNHDETSSPLANLSYKIIGTCHNACKDGVDTQKCQDCICCKHPNDDGTCDNIDVMDGNECLDVMCGGSKYNYVCCHDLPLEIATSTQ